MQFSKCCVLFSEYLTVNKSQKTGSFNCNLHHQNPLELIQEFSALYKLWLAIECRQIMKL